MLKHFHPVTFHSWLTADDRKKDYLGHSLEGESNDFWLIVDLYPLLLTASVMIDFNHSDRTNSHQNCDTFHIGEQARIRREELDSIGSARPIEFPAAVSFSDFFALPSFTASFPYNI